MDLSTHVCMLSHNRLFATPWTVAHQPPLSMGFPRQEYWRGVPFPTPGELLDPRIQPMSPELAGRFFYHSDTWKTRLSTHMSTQRLEFKSLEVTIQMPIAF